VARAIKEGLVKREDLFIVSKLWQTFHEKERVEPACRKSLEDWGLEYFDLYLIHFPVGLKYVDPSVRYPPGWHVDDAGTQVVWSNATTQETWVAMEGLVAKKLTKSIGISNFQSQLIYDLLRYAKIRPATLQVELHPYLTQRDLVKLAKHEGIALTAYSSFGPASFREFNWEHATKLQPLVEDPTIKELAKKYNKEPSQILLRWATQQGIAVIPKTSRQEILPQNLDVVGWNIDEADLDKISAYDRGLKFNMPTNVRGSRPFILGRNANLGCPLVLPGCSPLDLWLSHRMSDIGISVWGNACWLLGDPEPHFGLWLRRQTFMVLSAA
jgi:D-xylose reductase